MLEILGDNLEVDVLHKSKVNIFLLLSLIGWGIAKYLKSDTLTLIPVETHNNRHTYLTNYSAPSSHCFVYNTNINKLNAYTPILNYILLSFMKYDLICIVLEFLNFVINWLK